MTTGVTKARLSWRKRLGLVGFGLLTAVILVEMMGRLLHLMPVPAPPGYYEMRAVVGKFPLPYQYFIHRQEARELSQSEYATWVQFNYHGLRDIDHDYVAPPNSQRLMFIGDSFTAGWEVPLHETFVSRLRDLLADLPDRSVNYDLMNAGLYGTGTDIQYLFYREEGHRYDSDLVILQIYATNDVFDNGVGVFGLPVGEQRPYFLLDEQGQLTLVDYKDRKPAPPSPPSGDALAQLRFFLDQNSFSYRLARDGLKTLLQLLQGEFGAPTVTQAADVDSGAIPLDMGRFRPEYDEKWQEAWELTKRLVLALQQEIEAHGGRLAVVVVPAAEEDVPGRWQGLVEKYHLPPDWKPSRPRELWIEFLEAAGIPYLDLLPEMLQYTAATGDPLRFAIDIHFNSEGHCLVAVSLENWLLEQKLIVPPPRYAHQDPVALCNE